MESAETEVHFVLTGQQVSPTCTEAELKKAYKIGALKHHPGVYYSNPIWKRID